jgi:hypothetical protein
MGVPYKTQNVLYKKTDKTYNLVAFDFLCCEFGTFKKTFKSLYNSHPMFKEFFFVPKISL